MEGYLAKQPDSSSGKKKWSKYWFVLDKGSLSRYDSFDISSGNGVGLRDKHNVVGATIRKQDIERRNFCVAISFPTGNRQWILEAPDSKVGKAWLEELRLEASRDPTQETSISSCAAELGLGGHNNLSSEVIVQAFNRRAPSASPTNNSLARLSHAKNVLLKILEWKIFSKRISHPCYSVIVRPRAGDLGIQFIEDGALKKICVKNATNADIVDPAGATIEIGDVLFAINDQQVVDTLDPSKFSVIPETEPQIAPEEAVKNLHMHSLNRVNSRIAKFSLADNSEIRLTFIQMGNPRTPIPPTASRLTPPPIVPTLPAIVELTEDDSSPKSVKVPQLQLPPSKVVARKTSTSPIPVVEPQIVSARSARSASPETPNSSARSDGDAVRVPPPQPAAAAATVTVAQQPAIVNLSSDPERPLSISIAKGEVVEDIVAEFIKAHDLPAVLAPVLVSSIAEKLNSLPPEEVAPAAAPSTPAARTSTPRARSASRTPVRAISTTPHTTTPRAQTSGTSDGNINPVWRSPSRHPAPLPTPPPNTARSHSPVNTRVSSEHDQVYPAPPMLAAELPRGRSRQRDVSPMHTAVAPVSSVLPRSPKNLADTLSHDEEESFNRLRRKFSAPNDDSAVNRRPPLDLDELARQEDGEELPESPDLPRLTPSMQELALAGRREISRPSSRSRSLSPMTTTSAASRRGRQPKEDPASGVPRERGRSASAFQRLYDDAERQRQRRRQLTDAVETLRTEQLLDASFRNQLARSPLRLSGHHSHLRHVSPPRRILADGENLGAQIYENQMQAWRFQQEELARKRAQLEEERQRKEYEELTLRPTLKTKFSMHLPPSRNSQEVVQRLYNDEVKHRNALKLQLLRSQDSESTGKPRIDAHSRMLADRRIQRRQNELDQKYATEAGTLRASTAEAENAGVDPSEPEQQLTTRDLASTGAGFEPPESTGFAEADAANNSDHDSHPQRRKLYVNTNPPPATIRASSAAGTVANTPVMVQSRMEGVVQQLPRPKVFSHTEWGSAVPYGLTPATGSGSSAVNGPSGAVDEEGVALAAFSREDLDQPALFSPLTMHSRSQSPAGHSNSSSAGQQRGRSPIRLSYVHDRLYADATAPKHVTPIAADREFTYSPVISPHARRAQQQERLRSRSRSRSVSTGPISRGVVPSALAASGASFDGVVDPQTDTFQADDPSEMASSTGMRTPNIYTRLYSYQKVLDTELQLTKGAYLAAEEAKHENSHPIVRKLLYGQRSESQSEATVARLYSAQDRTNKKCQDTKQRQQAALQPPKSLIDRKSASIAATQHRDGLRAVFDKLCASSSSRQGHSADEALSASDLQTASGNSDEVLDVSKVDLTVLNDAALASAMQTILQSFGSEKQVSCDAFVQRALSYMEQSLVPPIGYLLTSDRRKQRKSLSKVEPYLSTEDREAREVRDKPQLAAEKTTLSLVKDRYRARLRGEEKIGDSLYRYQGFYQRRAQDHRINSEERENQMFTFQPQLIAGYFREQQAERRAKRMESESQGSSGGSSDRGRGRNPRPRQQQRPSPSPPKFRTKRQQAWMPAPDPADKSVFSFPPEVFTAT